ncbi:MAG: sigma-E factor negative regulatory protein [Burkholderiales bacterium]
MNTKNMTQEQISALIDNELPDEHLEFALAALRQADGRASWDVYHQIGDVMRSDEMAHAFSPNFAARLMERLDAEPTVVAPMVKPIRIEQPMLAAGGAAPRRSGTSFKRLVIPSAAAAVAVVALIANPQLRMAINGGASQYAAESAAAVSRDHPVSSYATLAAASSQNMNAGAAVPDRVILRDPRIDEYLLAHQRFSPSLYGTAQYARSAMFVADADK